MQFLLGISAYTVSSAKNTACHLKTKKLAQARSAVAAVWALAEEERQRHGALSRQNGARSGGGGREGGLAEEGEGPRARDNWTDVCKL